MKNLIKCGTLLFTFLSVTFFSFSQERINVTNANANANSELISLNIEENNQLYTWDASTIFIPKSDFEPMLVDCNKCICIRVLSPTKQFQDQAKAVYFSHRCANTCEACSIAGGKSSIEWKAHYQRVYPQAGMITIERSSDDQTIKKCGCNPGL